MFQFERQKQIFEYVNAKKKASVEELSNYFNVAKVTIRRDLDDLVLKGLVNKIHGGVLSIDNSLNSEIPYNKKSVVNTEEKKKIGVAASNLIEDGDVVILDAGSTTFEIAAHLGSKSVTVITNDIKIAMELAFKPNITLIITGGILEKSVYTAIGPETEKFISNIHVNKTFLGADAVSLKYGITNRTIQEVAVKSKMMDAAEKKIVVADNSKLNKKVFVTLCKINEIDILVTDKVDQAFKNNLNELGVEVVLA